MRNALIRSTLNAIYYSGLQSLLGFWTGGLGSILTLHHVRPKSPSDFAPNAHLQITPKFLDRSLAMMQRKGFEFVSLDTLHSYISNGIFDTNRRLIAITLDDGYRDNLKYAVPIFQKYNAPYTIYIAPGLVEGSADLWWEDLSAIIAQRDNITLARAGTRTTIDLSTLARKNTEFNRLLKWLTTVVGEEEQRTIVRELAWLYKIDPRAHSKKEIMNWSEINALSRDPLCTIGAHTIHHYAVARLSAAHALREMRESANVIKAEIGTNPAHFSYPYGYPAAAGQRDFKIARDLGFKTAVTTRHGVLHKPHQHYLHALPRISLNGLFQATRYVDTHLGGLPTLLQNRLSRINVR